MINIICKIFVVTLSFYRFLTSLLIAVFVLSSQNILADTYSPLVPAPLQNQLTIHYSSDKSFDRKIRRNMLDFHQLAGFTTLGLWLATNIAGDRAYSKLENKAELPSRLLLLQNPSENFLAYSLLRNRGEWEAKGGDYHKSLAYATFGMYSLTAVLSILSPSKYEEAQSEGFDSIFTHKLLAVLHFAAMASMPSLGKAVEHKGPSAAVNMQRVGWGGLGALSMSFFVFYF